ncbi:DUF2200 domain-containing protein [uncultured Microbulbifer sp.]|uniref:DUF2200 domain-containing protein n=1 Tax=uncultured Microbulbifer sp. TaxID=348147 RepID=UPI00260D494C|nr:DUF2200 domain-containing protein [uncultured Microbulbifer sp.]
MITTEKQDEKIAKMSFAMIYHLYVKKVENKGRTSDELNEVITWLTSYSEETINELIVNKATMKDFFAGATMNPNAHLITGKICGYKVENIQTPLTQQVRQLDKLVDELAKGHKMERILRSA